MEDLQVVNRIADVVNDHDEAVRQFGKDNARKLQERISALARVDNLKQMRELPGDLELLSGGEGKYSLKLAGGSGYRLILEAKTPDNPNIPRDEHGGIDESRVTAVTITDVRDYHD